MLELNKPPCSLQCQRRTNSRFSEDIVQINDGVSVWSFGYSQSGNILCFAELWRIVRVSRSLMVEGKLETPNANEVISGVDVEVSFFFSAVNAF